MELIATYTELRGIWGFGTLSLETHYEFTDDSEELTAFIFKMEEYAEQARSDIILDREIINK
jgi:hypothetical protein